MKAQKQQQKTSGKTSKNTEKSYRNAKTLVYISIAFEPYLEGCLLLDNTWKTLFCFAAPFILLFLQYQQWTFFPVCLSYIYTLAFFSYNSIHLHSVSLYCKMNIKIKRSSRDNFKNYFYLLFLKKNRGVLFQRDFNIAFF